MGENTRGSESDSRGMGEFIDLLRWQSRLYWLPLFLDRVGSQFSLLAIHTEYFNRMKVLLFTLIRAFEVDLAIPAENVKIKSTGVIIRPMVEVDGKELAKLPLVIKAVNSA